ncbi:MAG: AMP-binding protein [Phycisphaerae bacterium]|jgi:long-chain acyl-CoA synthetase
MHALLSEFESVVERQPRRLAVGDQSLMLDYASFRAVAAGLAESIAQQSEAPRVGVLAPTSAACAAAIFACWYAGRTPVPLNFLLAPHELSNVMRDAGLDLVVTIEHFAPAVQAAGLRTLLLSGRSLIPGKRDAPRAERCDTAVVIYTSGTSAEPKGVCLSFDNLLSNAHRSIEHARMTPDQVFLGVIPQFHSFGFTALTVLPLVLGATVWYLPRFSPVAVVNMIHEKQATIFVAVASMFTALARMKQPDRGALASLKLAISGGEPLPQRTAELFEQNFRVAIHEGYGLTETSPIVSINVPWAARPGSVGRPLADVAVTAVDAAGNTLAAGRTGELVVRGPCVMQGYLNKPAETAAVLRDGALFTGDLGHVDEGGFVYITGRAKEMLIIGGENVFPREIENVLHEHPAVSEAAVIGAPDALRGEVPAAFVILREGSTATEQELRDFCRQRLAGYKAPRDIRIATELPRGPTGKILKRALRL